MSNRTVIVASSAANKAKKFSTSATNLGELKAQSEMSGLVVGDVDFVVKPGNVTLRGDDSLLPTEDFKLFVIPAKNKAGNITPQQAQELGREIGEAIAKAASAVTEDEKDKLRDELINTIENFFGVTLDGCPECEEALEEARNL